jgi:predicted DsbA family dithiol-disulfide isomerase
MILRYDRRNQVKMRDYSVKAVPTTVIDGNIKVVGIPDFP